MGAERYVVGTRGSALARWQTSYVSDMLASARAARGLPALHVDVRVITTQGDVSLAERLVGQIEKGFFTAELEAALRTQEIDWAVHSLKDLPTRIPEGLAVHAVLERASPADWLVLHKRAFADHGPHMLPLVAGARVGTSSLRRDAMLRTFAPSCASQPLRGNVPTRIEKLRAGTYEAIVLAAAGVSRLELDLSEFIVVELDPRRWPPAPGQGAVAVEGRAHDGRVAPLLAPIDHPATRDAAATERAFLRVLEGGCSTPFGCFVAGGRAHMGRERDGAWVAVTVELPGPPGSPAIDEAFIAEALRGLERAPPASARTHAPAPHEDIPLWRRHDR